MGWPAQVAITCLYFPVLGKPGKAKPDFPYRFALHANEAVSSGNFLTYEMASYKMQRQVMAARVVPLEQQQQQQPQQPQPQQLPQMVRLWECLKV